MKGEIMFNNALTKVTSHYCIFTEALPSLIHRGFRLLSSLRRSSHHVEFAAITLGKDEVLPRANGPIVSSSSVMTKQITTRKAFVYFKILQHNVKAGPCSAFAHFGEHEKSHLT